MSKDNVLEFPNSTINDIKASDEILQRHIGNLQNVIVIGECQCCGAIVTDGTVDPLKTIHMCNEIVDGATAFIEMMQEASAAVIKQYGKKITIEEMEEKTKEYLKAKLIPPSGAA